MFLLRSQSMVTGKRSCGGRHPSHLLVAAVIALALVQPASAGCSTTGVTAGDNIADCLAMRTLYQSWGRRPLLWAPSVMAGDSYCSWGGVSCDGSGRVSGISLSNAGLQGGLPAVIGNLPFLQSIDLSSNQHSQQIPTQLGRLQRLTSLNLASNSFQGSIPPSLGLCAALVEVWLDNNQIGGAIESPPQISPDPQ